MSRRTKKKKNRNLFSTITNFYKLLKISWTVQTNVFFETSTLHGVRYLAEYGRPFIENIQDSVIGNSATILKTFSYNTLKTLSSENIQELELDKSKKPLLDYYESLIPVCNEIFTSKSCQYLSETVSCCDVFKPVLTEVGLCYSFNAKQNQSSPRMIKDTDPTWSVIFNISRPISDTPIPIYILDFNEVPTIDFTPQHNWDYMVEQISFSMKQTYTTNDTRQLSVKQRHCVFDDEIELKIDKIYTFSGCTRQCRIKNAVSKCQCVLPFYPLIKDSQKYCTAQDLKCIVRNLPEIENVDKCDCQLRCLNTVYEVEKMKIGEQSNNSVKMDTGFVSWPMVKYKREVLFGWVDLLVSFGGIAGLFLGCSLLSGVETIYFFTMRAFCMIFSERSELEEIQKKKALEPFPDYDLSMVPYFVRKPVSGNGIKEITRRCFPELLNEYSLGTTVIRVRPAKRSSMKFVAPIKPPFGIEFLN